MKKITCIHRDGYRGYDDGKELVMAEGDTREVSDAKHAQLEEDFPKGLFDFKGAPHKTKASAEDDGE